jgi:hypothetical protein
VSLTLIRCLVIFTFSSSLILNLRVLTCYCNLLS